MLVKLTANHDKVNTNGVLSLV